MRRLLTLWHRLTRWYYGRRCQLCWDIVDLENEAVSGTYNLCDPCWHERAYHILIESGNFRGARTVVSLAQQYGVPWRPPTAFESPTDPVPEPLLPRSFRMR